MSSSDPPRSPFLDRPPVRSIVDAWAESLGQVLEAMTDRKPVIDWRPVSGGAVDVVPAGSGPDADLLWWEQPFQTPGDSAWIGAPSGVWGVAGGLTLKAAGLETEDAAEARSAWLEIAGQSMGALARSLSSALGHEVAGAAGIEHSPDSGVREWAAVTIRFDEAPLPNLWFVLSPGLMALLADSPAPSTQAAGGSTAGPSTDSATLAPSSPGSRTMDLLLDVELPISISFGRTQLPMKDVLKLTTGSIVELNRSANDLVEVLVNECLIARGEVVVVEGNYAVRIQEIATRRERLRSIQ